MVDRAGDIRPAFATHNIRSIAYAIAATRARGLHDTAVELQLLYGMAEPVHAALRRLGVRVRAYAPVGELVPGMAYLVRRLLENTANESFLRHRFAEHRDLDTLIAPPDPTPPVAADAARRARIASSTSRCSSGAGAMRASGSALRCRPRGARGRSRRPS